MRDFINRYTGRIDYVFYTAISSIAVGSIVLVIVNKFGLDYEFYKIETLIGLVIGQLIIIGISLFIKRKFMSHDSK